MAKKKLKLLTEQELRVKLEELKTSSDDNIKRMAREFEKALNTGFENLDLVIGAISMVILAGAGMMLVEDLIIILSMLAIAIAIIPFNIIKTKLTNQKKFLRGRLKPNETVKRYYAAVDYLLACEGVADTVVLESFLPEDEMEISTEAGVNEYANPIHESIKSSIDPDYKKRGDMKLHSLSKKELNSATINRYKDTYKFLSHVKVKNTSGYLYFNNDDLVACIAVETKDDGRWIQAIEITDKYKGYGLSKQLLDVCVSEFKATHLSVNKNNNLAYKIYSDYGFKTYNETDTMYFMTLKTHATESNVVAEAYFKNDEDIYYNKDKFDSGEINLCFITGHSGSGKSTMGKNMAGSNIEHYELDDVVANKENFTMENFREYGGLIYSFFSGSGKKYYCTIEERRDGRYDNIDYEKELIDDFVDHSITYAKSHKNTKFVIEGVWLYFFIEPTKLKNYAVYIKGTSAIVSTIRAAKRDWSDDTNKLNTVSSKIRWLINRPNIGDSERDINKYRKYFFKLPITENTTIRSNSSRAIIKCCTQTYLSVLWEAFDYSVEYNRYAFHIAGAPFMGCDSVIENLMYIKPKVSRVTNDGTLVRNSATLLSKDYFDSRLQTLIGYDYHEFVSMLSTQDLLNEFKSYITKKIYMVAHSTPSNPLDELMSRQYSILIDMFMNNGYNETQATQLTLQCIFEEYFDSELYSKLSEEDIRKLIQVRQNVALCNMATILQIYYNTIQDMHTRCTPVELLMDSNKDQHLQDILLAILTNDHLYMYGKEGRYPNIIDFNEYGGGKIYISDAQAGYLYEIRQHYRHAHNSEDMKILNQIASIYYTPVMYALKYDAVYLGHGLASIENVFRTEPTYIHGKELTEISDIIDEIIRDGCKNILINSCNQNPGSLDELIRKYGDDPSVNVVMAASVVVQEGYDRDSPIMSIELPSIQILETLKPIMDFNIVQGPATDIFKSSYSSKDYISLMKDMKLRLVKMYQILSMYIRQLRVSYKDIIVCNIEIPSMKDYGMKRFDSVSVDNLGKIVDKLYLSLTKVFDKIMNTEARWIRYINKAPIGIIPTIESTEGIFHFILRDVHPVLEAPQNNDEDEDTPEDYTSDVEDEDGDDGENNDENESAEDFTSDVYDGEESPDDMEDEEESPEDFTANATDEETGDEPEGGEFEGEELIEDEDEAPADFTDDVSGGGEETTEDGEEPTVDDSGETTDDMASEDPNEINLDNSSIRNYNLMIDFQKLYKNLEDILTHLNNVSYTTSIQNSVRDRCMDNLTRLKGEVYSYIDQYYSKDFKVNIYYYTTYIQALKINLEMLHKNSVMLDKDSKQ